ncbi:ABC transporter ATP-binding protein [Clostridium sp. D43t1_170807_H7]|uniref:ABC transporter ATP-binding protein n=1 Tax=Clostridium sp. D43t1_170807_H7 TaxID=2787140 RepID=UPI00189C11F0|nr:ABC transporter ATP-binding protein [Clostridium sp. D43t1_170807_H7]
MYVIETNNLCKSYGKSRGIIDVNLKIKEGEIFGFVGPNGAGKSTTIRTLLNFIFPTSGSARILGKDMVKESSEIKKYIGYVPSEVKFYDEVKVKDIIKYSASFYNNVNKEEIDKLYKILDVDVNKKMSELSLGNKKKVAIVQALIHKPKLLILDEPTNGLDPLIQKKLFELLEEARKNGTTVFLSSHNLVEVESLCDRVAVIKDGKIIDTIVIEKLAKKLGLRIVIKSNEINEDKINEINGQVISKEKNEFIFHYNNGVDALVKELSKYKIEKLLISEQTLEDTFMNYYEGKDGK